MSEPLLQPTPRVALVVRDAFPLEHHRVGTLTVAAYRALPGEALSDGYASVLADADSRAAGGPLLVAVAGGEPVGAVSLVLDERSALSEGLEEGEAGIRMLAVDPERWGLGAGRALVEACLERARAAGKHRVVLHSTEWMTRAHGLYLRSGFVRTPARDVEVAPGFVLLCFVAPLDVGAS
jgi:GNAT superfamily N-acetyltransferase